MPAKAFAPPRPLAYDEAEEKEIVDMVLGIYEDHIETRSNWTARHLKYDNMWRGKHNLDRVGPFAGSANVHVQAPYWLCDAINTRQMIAIWAQVPLVAGEWDDKADEKRVQRGAHLCEWHLQGKRMQARERWARISKIRNIHGRGVGMISYANDEHSYRQIDPDAVTEEVVIDPQGFPVQDEDGTPVMRGIAPEADRQTGTFYRGPVLTPINWDDLVSPIGAMNLQPIRQSNPKGADWVQIRNWERYGLMKKKADGLYTNLETYGDKDWWVSSAPDQQRSGTGNQRRVRQEDNSEGNSRALSGRSRTEMNPNPEFEIITHFCSWTDPDGNEEEMVFFVSKTPRALLGGFYLTDHYWHGERPLLELHFQTTSTRGESMGVMEIVERLSDELDTIHNMRLDVGFATNLPFFFYRASTSFNPNDIDLRPMKGIPVDDPNDFTFPQFGNITSFYHQEETLLLTLIERVMGVTDLFLGVSPTQGASARHATGFVGTQQEAEARMSEVLQQDAEAFSFLCRTIFNLELQYGPEHRSFRLHGEEKSEEYAEMSIDELRMVGDYDFKLGANHGSFSQTTRQQQAQAVASMTMNNPLVMQSPHRMWEVLHFSLQSIGIRSPEKFIGRKEDLGIPEPKSFETENQEMDQYAHGYNAPAMVHPMDNDEQHLQGHLTHIQSEEYVAMGRPNMQGYMMHIQHTQQQMQMKMQQLQMQQAAQQAAPQEGAATGSYESTNGRAAAQLQNVPSGTGQTMMDSYAGQTAANGAAPPPMGL